MSKELQLIKLIEDLYVLLNKHKKMLSKLISKKEYYSEEINNLLEDHCCEIDDIIDLIEYNFGMVKVLDFHMVELDHNNMKTLISVAFKINKSVFQFCKNMYPLILNINRKEHNNKLLYHYITTCKNSKQGFFLKFNQLWADLYKILNLFK